MSGREITGRSIHFKTPQVRQAGVFFVASVLLQISRGTLIKSDVAEYTRE